MKQSTFNVAIVGSGPSGFYTAEALLNNDSSFDINVDMYDKLPVPFGLVRYGVAPDHPKLKMTAKVFDRIAQHKNFEFKGNIEIGKDISVKILQDNYDAVVLAYGASIGRKSGIKGEGLDQCFTATEFVGWYNGHPDFQNLKPDLKNSKSAVIIGQGNVAIDIVRILSKPVESLAKTDITSQAIQAIKESSLEQVHIIGRRGPAQSKFTNQELRELGEIEGVDVVINKADLSFNQTTELELKDKKNFIVNKNITMMNDFSSRKQTKGNKQIIFHFLKTPLEIVGDSRVSGINLGLNELTGEIFSQVAKPRSEVEFLTCDIIFFSIGYKGVSLEKLPFDKKSSTYPHIKGKVIGENSLYTAGWIKRGPTGIIGTNKPCAQETAASIIEGLAILKSTTKRGYFEINPLIKKSVVSFDQWHKIDQLELKNGELKGKSREKFTKFSDVINTSGKS